MSSQTLTANMKMLLLQTHSQLETSPEVIPLKAAIFRSSDGNRSKRKKLWGQRRDSLLIRRCASLHSRKTFTKITRWPCSGRK
jgi:hypothetical protein